ncbi:HTH-type transcriptional regulator CzcR [Paenibacillus lautus]|uniref:LysR family transcriptional regulator n=1 Tax=Paenibacillus TaxID=44249 RepID=UPI000BF76E52|nr:MULTISPECIES: LysR family transcriptional regulator [Paenibacillus]GIO98275.1 HTH-type transcriptional regulator CzcR [Paenibacillus lautus]
MDLTDLRVISVIVEEGSVSGAAEKMGYVQSNVTARIRKLESELGVPLFDRHPKGVTPTGKGLVLHRYAKAILCMTEEAVAAVKEPPYPSGPLVIGVVETMATSPSFIRALSDFQRIYPEVALSLVSGTSPQHHEGMFSRRLDGAFITDDYDMSRLESELEIREEVSLLVSSEEYGEEGALEAFGLSDASWIVFPKGCPFRKSNEEWLRSEGIAAANMIEISTLETMISCVRAKLGCALLPASAIPWSDPSLRAYPVPEEYRSATTRLLRRNESFRSKAFAAFAACVREAGWMGSTGIQAT